MKRFLVFASCLVAIVALFSFTANAATEGHYTYTVADDKATITDVSESISGDVTIPSALGGYPVTSIGISAFEGCESLTSITIPDSVTSIGDWAFYNCKSLTCATIGNNVTSIGGCAFYTCRSLASIEIPDGVTSIGDGAFNDTAYYNDSSNWEEGNWEDGVLYIGNHLIQAGYMLNGAYEIREGTKTIASSAFFECINLTSITIPNSVTSIGNSAFSYSTNLTSVTIGNGVMFIGTAFYGCTSLTSINIPDSVTYIGSSAFKDCTSLTNLIVDENNPVYHSIGNNVAEHSYDNACDAICNVCDGEREVPDHVYDNACDTTCNECGDVREITHDYGDEWLSDEEYHWQKCSVCEHETEKSEHTVEDGVCTVCGADCYTVGDVDGEEGISANDAIYLLYNVFFGDEAYPIDQSCDFDGDSSVTANDAIYLLYHVFFGEESYPLVEEDVSLGAYEKILNEYSQKLRDATPVLIEEYNEAAKENQDGLTGLATLCNEKVSELAEICTEGTQEMARLYLNAGSGSYEEYSEWADKLQDVYMEEAAKIQDAYMKSAIER